jgi:hypothetical protein
MNRQHLKYLASEKKRKTRTQQQHLQQEQPQRNSRRPNSPTWTPLNFFQTGFQKFVTGLGFKQHQSSRQQQPNTPGTDLSSSDARTTQSFGGQMP